MTKIIDHRTYTAVAITRFGEQGEPKHTVEDFHNPFEIPAEKLNNWSARWSAKSDHEFWESSRKLGQRVRLMESAILSAAGSHLSPEFVVTMADDLLNKIPDAETKQKVGKLIASLKEWRTCLRLGEHISIDPDSDF